MTCILEVAQLNKAYLGSGFQLKDVSFNIPYGSVVGFIGENGAGKSTTMEIILGTLKKDSGTITLFGNEMEDPYYKQPLFHRFSSFQYSHFVIVPLSRLGDNIVQTEIQK